MLAEVPRRLLPVLHRCRPALKGEHTIGVADREVEDDMNTRTVAAIPFPSARIRTVNSASNEAGSIHDDATARELGYAGGFVPGVTVLAYMARLMHEAYGAAWLATGEFSGRLRRPTYAGYEVAVEGTIVEQPSESNGGRVTVELRVLDPDGAVTASARASCRAAERDR